VVKKSKSPAEKIVENLIKLTTVPIEKSVIKWRMDKVFTQYSFEAEYKGKIYSFDGRHFRVYPAGYELPPGIRISEKSGPELLLHVRVDGMPKQLGELWQRLCGQHEKELQEDARKEREYLESMARKQKSARELAKRQAEGILKDFE